jgi:CBS domain-containing membrane protein
MFRASFSRWLVSFKPLPVAIGWPERLRSCLGALIGIAFTGGLMFVWLGNDSALPLLVAPMGASAVLLFAVPASPLAQPWSIIGGNIVSAIVGVACAKAMPNPMDAAPLAITLAIAGMFAFRCLHPPSGAVALTAVVGGPGIHSLGYSFVIAPIAVQSFALLALAIVFHAATGHRYPHAPLKPKDAKRSAAESAAHGPQSFTRADLQAVLSRRKEILDIDLGDLESLLAEVQLQSYVRTFSGLSCGDIMSKPAISVPPTASIRAAARLLRRHDIKALPVVDDEASVVGIITRAEVDNSIRRGITRRLSAWADRWLSGRQQETPTVSRIMTVHVSTIADTTPIARLVPIFAAHGHHHIPVLDSNARLAGMITQADLILGLYQQTELQNGTAQ